MTWEGAHNIAAALRPFMGLDNNHTHFPSGGGHDFLSVRASVERGCLEFAVSSRIAYIMKPRSLTLERIDSSPAESFLMLELDELQPSGVYERDEDEDGDREDPSDAMRRVRMSEELVDLGGGDYVERGVWDRGFVDHEDDPLPDEARLVRRFFRGRVMFVSKGSIWNGAPRTYSGVHDQASNAIIRQAIERAIGERQAA